MSSLIPLKNQSSAYPVQRVLFATFSDLDKESVASINDRHFQFLLQGFALTTTWHVERTRSSNSFLIAYLKLLCKFMFDRNYDIVICEGSIIGTIGMICGRPVILYLLDVPFASIESRGRVLRARFGSYAIDDLLYTALDQFAIRKAKQFIVSGANAAKLLTAKVRENDRRISVIPFYVDDTFFRVPELEPRTGVLKVGYAGGFLRHDLILDILEAARIAAGRNVELELLLAGEGPLLEQARKLADNMNGLAVSFLGRKSHSTMPEFLEGIDIFLAPMSSGIATSTLPTKILEAAAAGRATVTTDTGATRSIFGNTMLYAHSPIQGNIATCLQTLYENPQSRAELGRKVREVAKQHFTHSVAEAAMSNFLRGSPLKETSSQSIS